jgi:2-haloalkanoic acid dehalogenase type II
MLKVLAFDVFGTVFDLSQVDRSEVRAYVEHIRGPEWRPLELPESWRSLKAHADAAAGIARLRERFQVVTCSNGPIALLAEISKAAGISWDALIPLETAQVYKPNPRAYQLICDVMRVRADEVAMITANATFGDLEASGVLGMRPVLIRDGNIATIGALADLL